jgi:HSP20 family protein
MSNIVARKENPVPAARFQNEWEPARLVREMLGWDPFREMLPAFLKEERLDGFFPAFEVKETRDGFVFKADLPGVKAADVDISCTGNRLNVRARREAEKEEKTDTFYACEREYGAFHRGFTLPAGTDMEHVRAELKDGVLTIALAKKPEVQPKKVTVQTVEPMS